MSMKVREETTYVWATSGSGRLLVSSALTAGLGSVAAGGSLPLAIKYCF